MKKIFIFFSIASLCLPVIRSNAQNTFPATGSVGIGTTSPAASSLLEVRSTTKGFLTPRMTLAQRNLIGAPATGLLIYQTDGTAGFYYYYGSGWRQLLYTGANTSLSNLSTTVAVNRSLVAGANGTLDLGSLTRKWRKGYFTDSLVSKSLTTGSASTSIGVNSTGSNYGVYGTSSSGYGVYGNSGYLGVYGIGTSYGVYGYSGSGYGVTGTSGYLGVYGSGTTYGMYATGGTYGLYAYASASSGGYGVYGYNNGGTGVYGYNGAYGYGTAGECLNGSGVYGHSTNYVGVWGSTSNSSSYAGYFAGRVYSSGGYTSSDRKLKKDIADFSNAMDIILKLQPKIYDFRQDGNYKLMNLPTGKHYGLIAQDVETILPNLVNDTKFDTRMADPKGIMNVEKPAPGSTPAQEAKAADSRPAEIIDFKALNYTELIPILIKGMQELNAKNIELQNQVDELKSMIGKGVNALSGTSLSGYIKQNIPNPASDNTVISYYLPENAGKAQINITDIKGSVLKVYNVSKGTGQVNIGVGELAAGTYNYSLYVNDKRIDSKQMVITK